MERFPLVFAGHVDHGKSTIIGQLLIKSGNLPEGKLEAVRSYCKKNARPFEYAFLIDALKDEQAQGITIDTARVFFSTRNRDFIIIDAPGHIEFLKNMVTGASRAEAAFLVIAADEGIQENSRRHGYMLSILGIRQIVVLINKMDLVKYSEERFDEIKKDYSRFLSELGITPLGFIPVSGKDGVNIYENSNLTKWYNGRTVYKFLEHFEMREPVTDLPFRMYLSDIYRFTEMDDSRRIYAGTVSSGSLCKGDEVLFLPSNKKSRVSSIESFNADEKTSIHAGMATGVTLKQQIYTTRGELMVKPGEDQPFVSKCFRAAVFWFGKKPLSMNEEFFIKTGTAKTSLKLLKIHKLINTSTLKSVEGDHVNKHEAAECLFETGSPIVFDTIDRDQETGRFVIVHDYEIQGGGIILDSVDYKNPEHEPMHTQKSEKKMYIVITDRRSDINEIQKLENSSVINIREDAVEEVFNFIKEKGLIK